MRRAIAHIRENWREQPEIDTIAEAAGVTPTELHHLFRRWAGLTPKAFLQALTLDRARALLRDSASVLDASYEVGLSGPGRLHDLFVTHEAMSPGEWKSGGAGLTVSYGFHPSPFGSALVMATERGLAGVAFADAGEEQARSPTCARAGRRRAASRTPPAPRRSPAASSIRHAGVPTARCASSSSAPISRCGCGRRSCKVPMGRLTTYSDIAAKVCSTKAARAVGAAVGKNPLAFVVPCHRVIGRSGDLTGYHWGLTRKRAMLGWEAGRVAAA